SSKNSCMEKENRLYSISLGVASFAGWFGRCRNCFISCNVQAISSFLVHHFFVGLELMIGDRWGGKNDSSSWRSFAVWKAKIIMVHARGYLHYFVDLFNNLRR